MRCIALNVAKCSLALLVAVAAAALYASAWSAEGEAPAKKAALREGTAGEIVEKGTVESAQSLTIRCEVASPDDSGTAIVEIVPDGKVVQQGEILVKLDAAAWEEERKKQQVAVADVALVAKRAKDEVETAKLAKREYTEGTYVVQLQSIQNDTFVAEHELRRADEDLKAAGQTGKAVPLRQLEDARFAQQKARNELALAKARLRVLETLTKEKMLRQLSADLDAAESRVKVEEANLQFAQQRVAWIQQQVANCTIRAPLAGTVVYWGPRSVGGNVESPIRAGRRVFEGRPILSVADVTQLQIKVRIAETQASVVKAGMRATVVVDGLSNRELAGAVASVRELAESAGSRLGVKVWEVVVRLDEPPPGLRIGQSAEVRIPVRGRAAAATVPQGSRSELRLDQWFQVWDKNHDGRLDESEVPPTIWEHLRKFDANGDGFIDREEWKAVLKSLPPSPGR